MSAAEHMSCYYGDKMRKARLHSTIEITVNSDMDDVEEVSNTEQGIEDNFTTQRSNIQ